MTARFTAHAHGALRAASFLTALLLASSAFAAAAPAKYVLEPTSSLLRFTFEQAGASNTGRFGKYTADVAFAVDNLAASKMDVTIDVASLDTGDMERDDTLKSADLFNPAKFPKAHFVSSKIAAVAPGRFEAQGKLTIRDVTKDIKLPITFQTRVENGKQMGYLTGHYTLKRLEYGVGQGEWKSTEWVKDEVNVTFSLKLQPAG